MLIIKESRELNSFLSLFELTGLKVSFVPTMGALHQGHLALIRRANQSGGLVVCSIFVNPTQFNKAEDLEKYPVQTQSDIDLLKANGCDVVFLPEKEEIYPNGTEYNLPFDPEHLDEIMEGKFRPGHFKGVAQVVHRLLELVQPQELIMGEKDFQQVAVIRKMISDLELGIELITCRTVREKDGLAMSSRNQLLEARYREKAKVIYQSMVECSQNLKSLKPSEAIYLALEQIESAGLKPEYFELVDPLSLLSISDEQIKGPIQACVAAWAGDIRLIDNMQVRH
ncbi:MAG: pantoate--beta-alanine ligase [Saprospirales bacterium]|nr:MAG: pantoate--beta-alanine ligase [Saprospirales bacterium]